jgi:hypothetical protein
MAHLKKKSCGGIRPDRPSWTHAIALKCNTWEIRTFFEALQVLFLPFSSDTGLGQA